MKNPAFILVILSLITLSFHYLPVVVTGESKGVWVEHLSPEGKLYVK
jgi:hypothetical protein